MWGLMTALLPFLPGAAISVYGMWYFLKGGHFCMFFFTLLFFVPGVVLGTPLYMAFVMLTSCIKFFKPDLREREKLFCGIGGGEVLFLAPMLRMAEIVGESCPQSMLGRLSLKLLCLSNQKDDFHKRLIRYLHPNHCGPLHKIRDRQSASVSGDRCQSDFHLQRNIRLVAKIQN